MHPHVEAVFARLDEARAELRAVVDSVPAAARTQRPAPGRWSVAEVLEHISLVESNFARMLHGAIAGAMAAGLDVERAERVPLAESIAAMFADREKKRQAPDSAVPTGQLDAETAWAAIERSGGALKAALAQGDGLALSGVTHAHPFFGSLTAYQWLELMAAHRARHAAQVRELAQLA